MVEMAMFNVQRAIIPKIGKPELQFMCSALHLTVLYISVKFHENISNGISVMEPTQMTEALTDGWTLNLGGYNIIPSKLLVAVHKKYMYD